MSEEEVKPYKYTLKVTPIQVKSGDGKKVGNPEMKLFKKLTQNIYNQAQIYIDWQPWRTVVGTRYVSWDSSHKDTLGLRPLMDGNWPQRADEGVSVYFVDSIGSSYGLAWRGSNATAISNKVYNFIPQGDTFYYRGDTIAHEIGHLLNCLHVRYEKIEGDPDGRWKYYTSTYNDGKFTEYEIGESSDKYIRVLMAGGRVIGNKDGHRVYPLVKLYSDKITPKEIEIMHTSPVLIPYQEPTDAPVAEPFTPDNDKTNEPEEPKPEPVPEPVEPKPEPVPEPVEPKPEPVPEPVEPKPEPVEPKPEPVPEPEPVEPVPKPEPVSEPVEPKPEPVPEPVEPKPEPVPEPVEPKPEPVSEPVEPVPEPEPVEPKPEPVSEPVEPKPEPVPEPVEPKPEPVSEPVEPKPEPVPEPKPEEGTAVKELHLALENGSVVHFHFH